MWAILAVTGVVACHPGGGIDRHDPKGGPDDSSADTDLQDTADTDPSGGDGSCPRNMVLVEGRFCIDGWEATLEERSGGTWAPASPYEMVGDREVRATTKPGQVPQGYLSGDEAAAACASAGKRLCASEEWLAACQGTDGTTYPYGDVWEEGACNDDYAGGHPVTDYFGTSTGVWDMDHMNDPGINQQPGTVAPGGSFDRCVSEVGAFDLHGNLHEWVSDADGTFRGGFYADASINGPGCLYVTTAHDRTYHDYSTGFRCCADAGGT